MYLNIINDEKRKTVLSGELVLFTTHTTCSETHKCVCMLAYIHDVVIDEELFPEWKEKHLKYNKALGSGGRPATSEYNYIEFSLDKFRGKYDFQVTERRHS
jgi:hypothetical protein